MGIWIIGASTGIGLALAKAYAKQGRQVLISARSQEALESIAKTHENMTALALDMTQDSSVNKAMDFLEENNVVLDKVIFNAGTCEYIDFYEVQCESIRRVMETNFFGVINVLHGLLPKLRAGQKQGVANPQLAFMSSSVTYQALPRAGAYGASKAALRYFVETLRADLSHEGFDVRIISPGFVKTPLTDVNDFPMPFLLDADDAANRIIKGLASKTFDVHFPKRFTLVLKLIGLLPDWLRLPLIAKASRHDVKKIPHHKLQEP
ncbi:MAG: SDR family NAD(P)-dependent oxidoreductase [Gammaproteobacteria bacterium]|nr:SDR family NAD(P)-dependent oxidoreductase [Gammaproteobacteria bacterium]